MKRTPPPAPAAPAHEFLRVADAAAPAGDAVAAAARPAAGDAAGVAAAPGAGSDHKAVAPPH